MNAFEQLVTDVPGRAVRLLVVASACTALVAVLSGMSHKWDDAPTQAVAAPVFAKMAPLPDRVKAKSYTDPAPVEKSGAGSAAGAEGPAPTPGSTAVAKTTAVPAPVKVAEAPDVEAPEAPAPQAETAEVDPGSLDETASIPPETPQPRPKTESLTLKVPSSVRVRSGSSFSIGSASYRLQGVESIASDSCKRGVRGCTRRPVRTLRQAIAGATLKCAASKDGSSTLLSDCTKIKAGGRSRRASGAKRTRVAKR